MLSGASTRPASSLGLDGCWRQKRPEVRPHRGIALTSSHLEAKPVQNGEPTALAADQASLLKVVQGRGDGHAVSAEHLGQMLLGEWHGTSVHPIERHQHPARATLLDRMQRVAGNGLQHLGEQRVRVAAEQVLQGRRGSLYHFQMPVLDAERGSRDLDNPRVKAVRSTPPIAPSRPTVAASATWPSAVVITKDSTAPAGKCT